MLSTTVFRMYLCRPLDYGERWHYDQFDIDCTEPKHRFYQQLAVVGAAVYPFGVPLYFFVIMFHNRKYLVGDQGPDFSNTGSQTDSKITKSTGNRHRDQNRAAVVDGRTVLKKKLESNLFLMQLLGKYKPGQRQELYDSGLDDDGSDDTEESHVGDEDEGDQEIYDGGAGLSQEEITAIAWRAAAISGAPVEHVNADYQVISGLLQHEQVDRGAHLELSERVKGGDRLSSTGNFRPRSKSETVRRSANTSPSGRADPPRSTSAGNESPSTDRPGSADESSRPGSGGARGAKLKSKKKMVRAKTQRLLAVQQAGESEETPTHRLRQRTADICYHCKQPGHWKKNCPLLSDADKQEYRDSLQNLRRAHSSKATPAETPQRVRRGRRGAIGGTGSTPKAHIEDEHLDVEPAVELAHEKAKSLAMEYPDTKWGRGMKVRDQVPASEVRVPGVPHVDDSCCECCPTTFLSSSSK